MHKLDAVGGPEAPGLSRSAEEIDIDYEKKKFMKNERRRTSKEYFESN